MGVPIDTWIVEKERGQVLRYGALDLRSVLAVIFDRSINVTIMKQ